MESKRNRAGIVAAAALAAAAMVASTPAFANDEAPFSALQAVEAQALSAEEMQAITGEAYTSAVTLLRAVAATAKPPVSTSLTTLANALAKINVTTIRSLTLSGGYQTR